MTYPLHSKAARSADGSLDFTGDLYQVGLPFKDLVTQVQAHLDSHIDGASMTVAGRNSPGHRQLLIEVYATTEIEFEKPETEPAREELFQQISDEVWRFGFDNSKFETDQFTRSFTVEVSVAERYWANLQRKVGPNVIDDSVSLAKFKRELEPGHFFDDAHPDRESDSRYLVEKVGKRIVVVNDQRPSYRLHWDFPCADGFLCDGTQVRFARGSLEEPLAYSLYNWVHP